MSVVPDRDERQRRARLRVGAGAALVLVLLGLACAVLITAVTPHGSTSVAMPTAAPSASSSGSAGHSIYVHILGQVLHPGLYALLAGDRAVDAVAAAGGFAPDADQAGLNLARFVDDGEQIVVPAVGEAPAVAAPGAPGGKVNINTADEPTLETLPRVGPAMAQKIIAWRQANGRFASVQDLMSVSGIGEKTFDGLKDLVTVS